jgi:hypothetical protein
VNDQLFDSDEIDGTMPLDGMGPRPGERYRNVHTGKLCTIIGYARRRRQWVLIRSDGRLIEVKLGELTEHFEPYAGSLR